MLQISHPTVTLPYSLTSSSHSECTEDAQRLQVATARVQLKHIDRLGTVFLILFIVVNQTVRIHSPFTYIFHQ